MPHRILIVDDEPDELEGWRQLLTKQGYVVQAALTPGEALRICDELLPDLVILDYVMPRMKGLELLARIRQKVPLVRSILISAKLDRKVEEKQIRELIRGDVETDLYLHKPVSNEDVIAAISTLLTDKGMNRSWAAIAEDVVQSRKTSVTKAKAAQRKLKPHLNKKR